ncbi:MAG: hypothetical protein GY871_18130 [Actinomycetales bacterium]|nr:hypothetical protein [Actinomycetales bacterium]
MRVIPFDLRRRPIRIVYATQFARGFPASDGVDIVDLSDRPAFFDRFGRRPGPREYFDSHVVVPIVKG